MKYNKIDNVDLKELLTIDFDLGIFSCGYEKRCTSLFLSIKRPKKGICFAFDNHKENDVYKESMEIYTNNNVEIFEEAHNSSDSVVNKLKSHLNEISSHSEFNILVDYSSMSRLWYSSILFLLKYSHLNTRINLYFSYTIAKMPPDITNTSEIMFRPLEYISRISIPEKPTALIICIGDNSNQAIGLQKFFDAEVTYIFYANSRHSNTIKEINSALISSIPIDHIYPFPIRNTVYTKYILEKLCHELKDAYRIIIAPCGPKPFTLCSFIVSVKIDDIDVWRISKSSESVDLKEPQGEYSIVKLQYIP